MALALNKIILANATANTAGAYFQTTTIAVTAGGNTVVDAGLYIVIPSTNVRIQAQTAANTWANVTAANVGGTLVSDGVNVRLVNGDATNAVTVTALTVNGGEAATGTYNS